LKGQLSKTYYLLINNMIIVLLVSE